jgi:hypothetical protein
MSRIREIRLQQYKVIIIAHQKHLFEAIIFVAGSEETVLVASLRGNWNNVFALTPLAYFALFQFYFIPRKISDLAL